MFTKESNKIINSLVKRNIPENKLLFELFNHLNSYHFDYDKVHITNKYRKFPKIHFLSDKLYKKIKDYNKTINAKWTVTSNYSVECNLNLFSKSKLSDATINLLIYSISFIMSFANRDKKLTINIVLLPDKKIFNDKFTPNEINSGVCNSSPYEATIHIWRLEECIKVIFHECIHFLKFSSIEDTQAIIEFYNQRYNYQSDRLTIDEAYTEIWARIMNCYFASKLAIIHDETLNQYKYFSYLIEVEKLFSTNQSLKIIKYLKGQNKRGKKVDINRDTNVISYYIITSEILNNLNQFINFCKKNKNYFFLTNDFYKFTTNLNPIKYKNINLKFIQTFRMGATEIKIK